mgnify:FL=1
MRIIAGSARGTPLLAPKGMDTRPTQDKVKESLFNMLQGQLEDGAALDLFAGSGALGLEAVSRGASRAVLVDQSREASQCICRNIEKLRFQDRAELLTCDWKQAVSKLARESRKFDLVFLDPPYRMDDLGSLCDELDGAGLLNPEAVVVWERRTGTKNELPPAFALMKQRTYGDTEMLLYRYEGRAKEEGV